MPLRSRRIPTFLSLPRQPLQGGKIGLLAGLLLLEDCRVTIDYPARTVLLELTAPPGAP